MQFGADIPKRTGKNVIDSIPVIMVLGRDNILGEFIPPGA
jgi:hypothetical protein